MTMILREFARSCLAMGIIGVAACGGGGGGSPAQIQAPTLTSVALSPLTVSLPPGGTQQLTVTGTFSDSSTQTLPASGEAFASSNTAVATVSATGLVTVAAGAAVSSTATITVTDTDTKITSAAAASTVVTVAAAASGPPTANSVAAATTTAQNNSLCTAIQPFYWEIGDSTAALASASVGVDANGAPVLASTTYSIASASKWIYGMYVMQQLGSAAALTAANIPFLNFTSGYTNMGGDVTGAECPNTDSPDDINTCLALDNPSNNLPYSYKNPATVGTFNYDAGHLENYASLYGNIGTTLVADLGPTIGAALAPNIKLVYTEALMAGGIVTTAGDYAAILRNMLAGNLVMLDVLGTNSVCTSSSVAGCNATFTPIPEAWHYSIAHWVENDPATNGDGAFSSPGAFGFYPWVEAGKHYYGIISREQFTGTGIQQGYASAQCGRLIRKAFDTGTVQTAALPVS